MKSKILFLFPLITLMNIACKKNTDDNMHCDRVTAVNGRTIMYDTQGRLSEFTTGALDKISVSYQNNDNTIILKYSTGSEQLQLDNNGYYIKAEIYNAAGKRIQSQTVGRNSRGYSTDEVIELYYSDGTLDQRAVYTHTNAFDANGNLVKKVSVRAGYPADSIEYIYDITRSGVKYISTEASLLFATNPPAKNLLLREKLNSRDRYLYTCTTDAKGRLIYNKCTALGATGSGYENTFQYECN